MAATNLVIVESPAKAKTIEKYLGKDFKVQASIGHIRDLPKKKLGVDVDHDFEPEYEIIPGKKKVIDEIKKLARKSANVYLAPDPDREGEAIAWHVAHEIGQLKTKPKLFRVLFNEITKNAIQESIKHPTEINHSMFEAQQARRILDRLVGYKISPILWDKVRRGLSAGRVQSVAVRIICEREDAIRAFKPIEYWEIESTFEGSIKPSFKSKIQKKSGKKLVINNQEESESILADLKTSDYILSKINKKASKRNPTPPFITSKLQQDASRQLGFTAKKTMMLAQRLYEGIDIGSETVGLITYMRTDSTRVSDVALEEVREYIQEKYGEKYLPQKPHVYKSKKAAQDAHECIRPTSMQHTPESVKKFLEKDAHRLYELIWKRFVACQMNPAIIDRTTFIINNGDYEFRANGSIVAFPGFMTIYMEGKDEDKVDDSSEGKTLPDLKEGEVLKLLSIEPSQHFTQPPPRFTEASLVKELEEQGIGRPSTYASILSVIQDKEYTKKDDQRRFRPTDLGEIVNKLLVSSFPNVMDVEFTARMESELDDVEEGKLNWKDSLKGFYETFSQNLVKAKSEMKNIKRQEVPTDIDCEKCGDKMVIKFGRHGEFLACKNYPDCKSTKEFSKNDKGEIVIEEDPITEEKCEKCSSDMVIKRGKFGEFLACSKYPDCKFTKALPIGVDCPKCGKDLAQRRTKRGKTFYGCTGYPKCDFASWDRPVAEKCPQCESPYLVEKISRTKDMRYKCPEKECGFEKEAEF